MPFMAFVVDKQAFSYHTSYTLYLLPGKCLSHIFLMTCTQSSLLVKDNSVLSVEVYLFLFLFSVKRFVCLLIRSLNCCCFSLSEVTAWSCFSSSNRGQGQYWSDDSLLQKVYRRLCCCTHRILFAQVFLSVYISRNDRSRTYFFWLSHQVCIANHPLLSSPAAHWKQIYIARRGRSVHRFFGAFISLLSASCISVRPIERMARRQT